MIQLMKRILAVSGRYKRRIQIAFVFSFLKSLLAKAPIMLAFLVLSSFYEGTITAGDCLWYGIALVVCVLLQVLFHHIADRLQSAAGFLVFSDMRMDLGAHLRRMPMGYFTEGNIGKISSVLSSDMVFIEENCMTVLADMMSYIFAQAILVVFLLCFDLWIGLAALAIIGIVLLIARGMKREALQDSVARQEQNENLTEAVLDFVEGIGIIKTYNLLGEKSRELTDNFQRSCDTSLQFEEDHSPWQLRLNLAYGLGAAAITAIALALESAGLMSVPYLVGIMLFVFDLFGPIKALYTQATRLTVMNSCMDRIEEVFHETELPDDGRDSIPEVSKTPEVEFQRVRFAYGEKEVLHDIKSRERKTVKAEKKSLPAWQVFKHKELAAKIAALTEDLEELRSEKALLLQQFDYAEDAGAETFRKDITVLESNLEKLDEQEQKYSVELETALHEYAEAKSKTAGLDPVELYEARQSIRPGQEAAANEKLEQVFGEKYSPLRWMDAKRAQMRLTNDSVEEYAARQLAKQKCKSMLQPARRREQEHAL